MPAREIKGAIHVHSDYSDGSGSVADIVKAAQQAGLDYVVLTDHDTIDAALDGLAGRHGKVLLVVGGEVSPSGRGHCLVLGDVDITGYRWMSERFYLYKLRRDGADVYIAHPEGRTKPTFGINLRQWHVWETEQFAGMEIWSYMHDWIENVTPLNAPLCYLHPDRAIDGPDQRVLRLWDRLNLHRRVAGIGALDAHAVRMLFGAFVAFSYEKLFRTLLTHVWVDDWGSDWREDTRRLRAALRAGRAFVAYDALAPAEGFAFSSQDGLQPGDRTEFSNPTRLNVTLPRRAEVRLVHNGRHVDTLHASQAAFDAARPGLYRIEAYIDGRPWIFSNPMFFG